MPKENKLIPGASQGAISTKIEEAVMTDIHELPDKWEMDDIDAPGDYGMDARICIDELCAALPKWTRITDDPDTWPDHGQRIVTIEHGSSGLPSIMRWDEVDDLRFYIGDWWRPLCDLDYPPKENTDD